MDLPKTGRVLQPQTTCPLDSSPTKSVYAPSQKKSWPPEDELIPDSEEERVKERLGKTRKCYISTDEDSDAPELSSSPAKRPRVVEPSVIVISSDSDEEVVSHNSQSIRQPSSTKNTFLDVNADSSKAGVARKKSSSPNNPTPPPLNKGKGKGRTPIPRGESDRDSDVICISDVYIDATAPAPSESPVKQTIQRTMATDAPDLDIFDPDHNSDDSAILTFDPHVRAKPVPRAPSAKPKTPARNRELPGPAAATPSPSTPARKQKKVSPAQLHIEAYAQTLFNELNASVFEGRMPADTELVWNVRLISTAGRAFFTRNKQQQMSLKIELSPKVVDCDERVRHTLAHEMCHLAVWALDGDPHEQGHGPQFKAWAARVTKARPDITISTKHTYNINYKFQWECIKCGKIYGRHSNSINVEKSACGVCDPPGRLKPLFEKRAPRTPKAASGSKLASGSPRESPRSLGRPPRSPTKSKTKFPTPLPTHPSLDSDVTDSDDVEDLIKGLGAVTIGTRVARG